MTVEGTRPVPLTVTEKTILLDLMKHPAMLKVFQNSVLAHRKEDGGQESEAGSEAVTADMSLAMEKYMPLRGMISFSGGKITHEILAEVIRAMNEAE